MTRLRRFLILGSEGGSYYADERKLTLENAAAVKRCITSSEDSGIDAVTEIARISKSRRAAKPAPALFALAMAASYGSEKVRKTAFDFLNDVALTGSHLQMFIDYVGSMRGWGRGLRRAVAKWYLSKDIKNAVYQAVKYRQRYNWTHRDLLRKAHPKAASSVFNDFFAWVTQGTMPDEDNDYFSLIHAYEEAKTADENTLCNLIVKHQMTWEMVPAEMLDKKQVWMVLVDHMPVMALVRNLATLTRLGVIAPMQSAAVCQRLGEIGNSSIIHPINVLSALLTYRSGKSVRGSNPGHRCHRSLTPSTRPLSGPLTRRLRPTSGSIWASTSPAPWAVERWRGYRAYPPGWPRPPWLWSSPAGSLTTTWPDLPRMATGGTPGWQ